MTIKNSALNFKRSLFSGRHCEERSNLLLSIIINAKDCFQFLLQRRTRNDVIY